MPLTVGSDGNWVYSDEPTYPGVQPQATAQPQMTALPQNNNSAIEALYQQNLGRAADAEGLNYWANSGLSTDQISNYMRQSDEYRNRQAPVGALAQAQPTVSQTQPSIAAAPPAPPRINYYDTPTFDPNAVGPRTYWVSDRLGFSENPAVTGGLSALSVRDPVTGSVNSQSVLSSPASMLEYLQRIAPDLTLEDLQGLQAGREAVFRNFGVQSNPAVDKVVDFDALSRGQLGTDFNWTYDTNVGSKGPAALGQLQRAQELAQRYGIQGANTGLIGYDIPDYYGGAIGDEPGGIRTYSPFEDLGISPDAYTDHTLNQGTIRLTDNGWERTEKPQLDSVRQLYRDVLGREPDAQGTNYWRNSGLTLDQIVQEMAKTPEGRANPNAAAAAAALTPQPPQQTSSPFAANVAQLEKRQNEVPGAQSPFAAQTAASGQGTIPGQQFGLDTDSYVNLLLGMGGDITPENLMAHRDQLLPALQAAQDRQRNINYTYGYLTDGPDASLLTDTFSGTTPTRLGEIAGLTPQEVAYAEKLLSGNYAEPFWTGEATRSVGNRATGTSTSAVTALANAGYSFSDIDNILRAAQAAGVTPAGAETTADALRREAAARFIETTGLRPDDGGGFGTFIKDAFKSPVGAAILAGLTGGLGGFGAIGSGLTGGALQAGSAGAAALGGGAIGAGRAALTGGNILKDGVIGAATAGLGASGLGNSLSSGISNSLGGGALAQFAGQALPRVATSALTAGLTGGDVDSAALNAALNSGVGFGLGQISGFQDLPQVAQDAIRGGITSGVTGDNALQGALGSAISSAGRQIGNMVRDQFAGNSYLPGLDVNDIEPNSFPPQEGDTFNDQTDYFALTAHSLSQRAIELANAGDIAGSLELTRQAELLNDLAEMQSPFIVGYDQNGRPVTDQQTQGEPYYVDIFGAESELTPTYVGGIEPEFGSFNPDQSSPDYNIGPRYVEPVVAPEYEEPLSPLEDLGEIFRPPVTEVIADDPLPRGDFEPTGPGLPPLSPIEEVGEITRPPVTPVVAPPPSGGGSGGGRPSAGGGGSGGGGAPSINLGGGGGGNPIAPYNPYGPVAEAGGQKSAFDAVAATAALGAALQQAYEQMEGIDPGLRQVLIERMAEQGQQQIAEASDPYAEWQELEEFAKGGEVRGTLFAAGGEVRGTLFAAGDNVPHKGSHYVQGAGGGQDDLIDARLADGEYVFDADIVAALGDGSNKEGAKKLDAMREVIRKHKRSAPHDKIPPKAKSPLTYMKEALK